MLNSCGGKFITFPDQEHESGSLGFSLSTAAINSNLGIVQSHTILIDSKNYSGEVPLSIDRSALDQAYSAGSDIVFSLDSARADLTAGQLTPVNININVLGSAPSFLSSANGGQGEIKLISTRPDTMEATTLSIPMTVNAIYEVILSVDGGGAGMHRWSQPASETFRKHDGDLVIRFINSDTTVHRFHSTGEAFPHEPDNPPAGGTYEVIVDQTARDTTYYCHTHDDENISGNGPRILSFGN